MVVKTKNSSGRSERFQFFLTIDFPSIDLGPCSGESFRSYLLLNAKAAYSQDSKYLSRYIFLFESICICFINNGMGFFAANGDFEMWLYSYNFVIDLYYILNTKKMKIKELFVFDHKYISTETITLT